jgi:hypothetical protein
MNVHELLEEDPTALRQLSAAQRNDPALVRTACRAGGVFMFNHAGPALKSAIIALHRAQPDIERMSLPRLLGYLDVLQARYERQKLSGATPTPTKDTVPPRQL